MNVEYCSNCGHKIEYGLHKPNFCPQCGTQIATGSIPPPKQVDASQGQAKEIAESNEGEDPSVSLASLRAGLKYEVDYGDLGYKQTSFEQLASEEPTKTKKKKARKIKKKETPANDSPVVNAEASLKAKLDVVKDSLAECASSVHNFRDAEEKEDLV